MLVLARCPGIIFFLDDGFLMAAMRSSAAYAARSVDDKNGILPLLGGKLTVSMSRSPQVKGTHIL